MEERVVRCARMKLARTDHYRIFVTVANRLGRQVHAEADKGAADLIKWGMISGYERPSKSSKGMKRETRGGSVIFTTLLSRAEG